MSVISKGIDLRLGMLTSVVSVESALFREEKFVNCCVGNAENAHDPIPVSRPLTCKECGFIDHRSTKKADKIAGKLTLIDESALAEIGSSDMDYFGRIDLVPYPMEDVVTKTGQGEKLYVLNPTSAPETYSLILKAVSNHPDKAFVAKWTIRTRASLFVARVNGSALLLEERTFTDNLKPMPDHSAPINEAYLPMIEAMIETASVPFDQHSFSDTYHRDLFAAFNRQGAKATDELLEKMLIEYRQNRATEASKRPGASAAILARQ
jgi:non-homologous end joining protein Ku